MAGKRKTRMGNKDVAIEYTKARALKRYQTFDDENGGRKRQTAEFIGDVGYIKEPNLWPTERQLDDYAEFTKSKQKRGGRPGARKKPMEIFFPLLEQASGFNEPHKQKTVDYLLTCASLEVVKVRRYPGWILSKTYNLKNRPLDLG